MRKKMLSCAATAALVMLAAAPASARDFYVSRLPSSFSCSTCHVSPGGGGPRNSFGQAFEANSTQWDASLCAADSDGDGASNGAELGDPMCMWTTGAARPTAVSKPGDSSDKPPVDEPDMGSEPEDMGSEPPEDMGSEPPEDMGVISPPEDMGGTGPIDMGADEPDQGEGPVTGGGSSDDDEGCAQAGLGGAGAGAPGLLLGLLGLVGLARRRR